MGLFDPPLSLAGLHMSDRGVGLASKLQPGFANIGHTGPVTLPCSVKSFSEPFTNDNNQRNRFFSVWQLHKPPPGHVPGKLKPAMPVDVLDAAIMTSGGLKWLPMTALLGRYCNCVHACTHAYVT